MVYEIVKANSVPKQTCLFADGCYHQDCTREGGVLRSYAAGISNDMVIARGVREPYDMFRTAWHARCLSEPGLTGRGMCNIFDALNVGGFVKKPDLRRCGCYAEYVELSSKSALICRTHLIGQDDFLRDCQRWRTIGGHSVSHVFGGSNISVALQQICCTG